MDQKKKKKSNIIQRNLSLYEHVKNKSSDLCKWRLVYLAADLKLVGRLFLDADRLFLDSDELLLRLKLGN